MKSKEGPLLKLVGEISLICFGCYHIFMEYKYTGIILDKKDVGETDRIYSIFTLENGKIRVLAKGVRKANAKLAGFLENFTLAEIFIAKSHGMGKITGSIVIDNFSEIRKNFNIIQFVFETVKIFNKFVREESKDQKIFELLKSYLEAMNNLALQEKEEKSELVFFGFLFKFLEESGYKIEIENCIECGKKVREIENFFDPKQGGIICGNCSAQAGGKIRISPNSVKIIRIFFQNSIGSLVKLKIDQKDMDNIKMISKEFLRWTV